MAVSETQTAMMLLWASTVGDSLTNVDKVASGLEKGPITYVAALSLLVNLGLFLMLMRVQALRVGELKDGAERAEKLGGIIEKHNQAMGVLERAVSFVMAQQPRRRGQAAPTADLGPEPQTSKGLPK